MSFRHALRAALVLSWCLLMAGPATAGQYQNFKVAIYVAVGATRQLADPRVLEQQYERVSSQLKFDKVYLETYRDRQFADDASLVAIKKFFTDRGIEVAGGVTLAAGGENGQFGTFDYENPKDREECRRAVEQAARHFDEVILDDFFFYTSKSHADIAAKGKRSWTQYRLEKMREASANLVLAPAKAANPRVKVIIKYPNWYEHFQGLGYDLDVQAKQFDAIYTGTETRDPYITDQLLQQYLSYLIFRYFDNVRPGGANRGGWVDTFSTRYIDRYAEQLWDTLFAKAPEITLFNWSPMASAQGVQAGDRDAWADKQTSFVWNDMVRSFKPPQRHPDATPGWARAAGYSLEQVDAVLGKLGKPIGVASYKPYQSSGEDFLHTYLGNIGIPIELTPTFPEQAGLVLLTESAKQDPAIVRRIKAQLVAGKSVVITSGLLRALQGRGIEDIVELEYTDHRIAIRDFLNAYGAGNGTSLNDPAHDSPAIVFPEIRFHTNDSWTLIRGVANAKGFPILLMNRYSRGVLYVLTMPDNFGDLYSLPQAVTNVIKGYLQPDFPVRIDAPSQVSLFAYDNGTFVVQSFRPTEASVRVSVAGANRRLRNVVSNQLVPAVTQPAGNPTRSSSGARSDFVVEVQPHSYMVFAAEEVGAGDQPLALPSATSSTPVHPQEWPAPKWPLPTEAAIEARVQRLLTRMTLEEKVGQVIQADIASVTPAQVREFHLGSVLNGGSTGPGGDDFAPAPTWLALADAFYRASVDTSGGRTGIPVLWGTDAVHGHGNIIGATLFPHNIGLGAMRNPELMKSIATATAREVRVTGMEWTFAPTLAVPQDVRWGRSYEGYSQDPQIVASYAGAVVTGLQGQPGRKDFLRGGHVLATAKHFLGDGGTYEGRDQGDTRVSESTLRDIHGAGYPPAIAAGVQTIMASYNSWNGVKMHGNHALLTDVLKGRMSFNGFVVGDWNGHAQIPGCQKEDCPQALLAGLDMYMAPDSWRGLYDHLLAQARAGKVPKERLDDAVARILRVKLRMGLFEAGPPSKRELGGSFEVLGSAQHRAVARDAVRQSLVLLKNANHVLPLKPAQRILVAGDGADDIAKQSGGWTITWQGTGVNNSHFPGATSIWQGIRTNVEANGGSAELSVEGRYTRRPDAAIVVFGEGPYAETRGDVPDFRLRTGDDAHLGIIRRLQAEKIPVIAVLLSGRPLWMNQELSAADAFVAGWLPGSEGGGLADVMFRKKDGGIAHDFRGRLSFAWPARPMSSQTASGRNAPDALFPLGYGLTYADEGNWQPPPEEDRALTRAPSTGAN